MKGTNILLIVVGILIFAVSSLSGGLLFYIPFPGPTIGWFIGVILVALGLWLNEKEKKTK